MCHSTPVLIDSFIYECFYVWFVHSTNIKYKVEIAIIKTPKYPVGACFVKKAKNISNGIKNQYIFLSSLIAKHKE